MTASVRGFPWFVLTRLGVVHAKGPFVWIEALSGPEWNLEICAAQHEKRSDVFCFVLWFQCVSMYAELPNNSWSLKSNLTASYHMMAFWIEVIWVVDSFQLLHGIPFRWRPSIESGPRGGTGFLGTLGTLVLSSKPYWQYDAIRNHHFITLVCGGCFENVSKLVETEKKQAQLVSRC